MRILVGPTEICGQISLFADGFRKLGHEVTTAVVFRNKNWWDASYDYDFTDRPFDGQRIFDAGYLLGSHDVFLYQWARDSFLPNLGDLPFLQSKGKKIISAFMGSDVRHYPTFAEWLGPLRDYILSLPFNKEDISSSLVPLRMAEAFSSVIFSQPNQSLLGVRPYHHLFIPVDLSKTQFHIPNNPIPKVLHIPARRGMKGTSFFLEACEALHREGVVFELRTLEDIPNSQVLSEMRTADIYLDELLAPLYGKTAIEAMGCGCAVVNGADFVREPYPPERPIWSVNPWNLKERLRELIENRELRISLAEQGRVYAQRYHDHVSVCDGMLRALEDSAPDSRIHYPTLYTSGECVPHDRIGEDLLQLTDTLVLRWGLPRSASIDDLVNKKLLSPAILGHRDKIPRWGGGVAGAAACIHESTAFV